VRERDHLEDPSLDGENIKIDLVEIRWEALVNAVINFWTP
jgi:hypothetical protein